MTGALQNVVMVLFQPQDVVNVAGVIRVMSNFGLRRLRLVEPAAFDPYRIEGIAHSAGVTGEIVAGTGRFPDLPSALADCGFVLGTTGRPRETRRERLTPRQAAPLLLRAAGAAAGRPAEPGAGAAAGRPVAVLFGREKDGLPNDALDLCHAILTIPTDPANRSLNLAQAALVVAWELWMAATAPAAPEAPGAPEALAAPAAPLRLPAAGAPPLAGEVPSVAAALAADAELASGTEREAMFRALADLLRAVHPRTTEGRLARAMSHLRAVLLRAAPRSDEARMLAGLFAHLARMGARSPAGATDPRE